MSQTLAKERDFTSIEQLARLIRQLNRREKVQLLQLVPELQIIQLEEAQISEEQAEVMAYFESKLDALPGRRPMREEDPFVAGLTVGEFFALSEAEQDHIWATAHQEAERQAGDREYSVQTNAVSAR